MGQNTADEQTAPLAAAWLDIPCICQTVNFELSADGMKAVAVRDIGKGEREK
jgi:electron transfer flavoprotein alpha/beta subunit